MHGDLKLFPCPPSSLCINSTLILSWYFLTHAEAHITLTTMSMCASLQDKLMMDNNEIILIVVSWCPKFLCLFDFYFFSNVLYCAQAVFFIFFPLMSCIDEWLSTFFKMLYVAADLNHIQQENKANVPNYQIDSICHS